MMQTSIQVLPRYCPRCGAPIVTSSGACTTCGLPMDAMLSKVQHTEHTFHDQEHIQGLDQEATQSDLSVQQDEPLEKVPTLQLSQQSDLHSETQAFSQPNENQYPYSPALTKRRMGRKGFLLLLLALLLVMGSIAYATAGFLGVALPGFVNIQPTVMTTAINSSVPYAGVEVTILNVQQSQSFINDPNSSSNGMVRVNLREHNLTDARVMWSYETVAHLMLPNKSIISPAYVHSFVSLAPGASQTSVIDFAVPSNDSVHQLTFVLGATNEAQIFVPLVQNANLSNYQPVTVNLHGQMQYFGLNWTLTRATSSLSIQGQQAAKDMRYITLTLKVDNTLSQEAITGSPYEYMRLQTGNTTAMPKYTTIPVSFNAGTVGITGAVSFEVPQNAKSFTLVLVPQKGDSGDQGSTDFQIP